MCLQCNRHTVAEGFKNTACVSRSIRRSVRSGSIKLKQTYEHLMENGDIGAMNRMTSSRSRPQDLDIKLLQAKRQQAEMRRYKFYTFKVVMEVMFILQKTLFLINYFSMKCTSYFQVLFLFCSVMLVCIIMQNNMNEYEYEYGVLME